MSDLSKVKKINSLCSETVRFYIIFVFCLLAFGITYILIRTSPLLDPFLEFNALISSLALNLLGANTSILGTDVSSSTFSFRVIAECTSLLFTGIFASAVMAWPSTARQKMAGIGIAALGLFLFNLVRIVSLFYIGTYTPTTLDFSHFFVWPIVMILLTVGLWLLWTEGITETSQIQKASHREA